MKSAGMHKVLALIFTLVESFYNDEDKHAYLQLESSSCNFSLNFLPFMKSNMVNLKTPT